MRRTRRLAIGALLAFSASASFGAAARFGSGAEVEVPPSFAFETEEGGKTLVIHPKGTRRFELRITFHSVVPHLAAQPEIATEFIVKQAAKANAPLVYIGSRRWVGYTQDLGRRIEDDGVETSSLGTNFAIREGVVVATFTAATRLLQAPDVNDFLNGHMEKILTSVKYSGR